VTGNIALWLRGLTGKYPPDSSETPSDARRIDSLQQRWLKENCNIAATSAGEKHGRTPAQVALNWLIAQGRYSNAGAKTAEQVRQNAGALGWRLSDEEVAGAV